MKKAQEEIPHQSPPLLIRRNQLKMTLQNFFRQMWKPVSLISLPYLTTYIMEA